MRRVSLFVILSVLLVACGSSDLTFEDLGKTEWTLVAINSGDPVGGAAVTLNFFDDDLNGTTGCNVYNATYSMDGKSIEVSDMLVTQAFCEQPAGIMEQEQTYMTILGEATQILMEDGQLMLLTEDERFLLFDE